MTRLVGKMCLLPLLLLFGLTASVGANMRADDAVCAGDTCSKEDGASLMQIRRGKHQQTTSSASASPTEPAAGFCCWGALDPSDVCGTCRSQAASDSWCGASKENCEGCSSKATWCTGSPTPSPPTPSPTDSPTPSQAKGGAPWGADLVKKVVTKLVYIMGKGGRVANQIYPLKGKQRQGYECLDVSPHGNISGGPQCSVTVAGVGPKAYLRMGFHDCVRYTDGSGGCDGCLNMDGMFAKYDLAEAKKKDLHLPESVTGAGDSNNLALAADILEALYTDKDFPKGMPKSLKEKSSLPQSLQDGGQSRADLWALATLVGAQIGFSNNEAVCQGKGKNDVQKALSAYGKPYDCSVKSDRKLTFYSGRSDCTEGKPDLEDKSRFYRRRPWEIEKAEQAGNNHMNGQALQELMEDDFGFTPRETVALMGAHSFADFAAPTSLFAYTWKRATSGLLNNEYYQLISLRPHLNKQTKPSFATVGSRGRSPTNNTGGLANSRWLIRRKSYLASGGPWQWSHQYQRCPYCKWNAKKDKWDMLEPGNGGSKYFRTEHCCKECAKERDDPTFDDRCLAWVSQDEEALAPDAGLYIKFDWDPVTGKPKGCNLPNGLWKGALPDCEKNDIVNPGDRMTMAEIVDEYADDQKGWAKDFIGALEKMLSNGASAGGLKMEWEFPPLDERPS